MKNLHQINDIRIPPEFRSWAASLPHIKYVYDRARKWMYTGTGSNERAMNEEVLTKPQKYPGFYKNLEHYRNSNDIPPNIEII